MYCWEAIQEAFQNEDGVLTTRDVINRVYARHPDRPWKESSISADLVALSLNHSSSHHYPSTRKHGFLFSLGNGRYRLWDREKDGTWVVTETGVELADESQDVVEAEEESELEASEVGTGISLERDLEASLLADLGQLESDLTLYEGEGRHGYQLDSGVVGRLDILAIDSQGSYVVIELKAGQADEKVFGQILRYMGWVKRELAGENAVRGIVVANDFHERAKYAAEVMPNVTLKRYEVHFNFLDV